MRDVFFGVKCGSAALLGAMSFAILSAAVVLANDEIRRRQELFEQMIAAPGNLDIAFEYAALSVKVGDLEGAIGTLERMLIYAPGLPRIQLELGVLYFRLGSMEMARSYFQQAVASPAAPAEVKARVNTYLAAIDGKQAPSRFSAALFTGMRWQSNANAATDATEVLLNGIPFTLDDSARAKSDFAFYATGNASYSIDLKNQGDRLEFDAVTYGAWQFEQTELDTQLIEATMGPAFNMKRFGMDNTYLGVYAIGNGALLDEAAYFGSLGAGARLVTRLNEKTEVLLKGEYRNRWFNDTADRPVSSLRDGDEYRAAAGITYLFSENVRLSALARTSREDVAADFYDSWEYGGQASATVIFKSPPGMPEYPWSLNLAAGYTGRDFDAPDPAISLGGASEHDDQHWASAALNVPVRKWLAVIPQVEYREQDSNYPTREFNAWTISLGLYAKY